MKKGQTRKAKDMMGSCCGVVAEWAGAQSQTSFKFGFGNFAASTNLQAVRG